MQLENFAATCGPEHLRSSSADEHPTSLGAALAGTIRQRHHQSTNARCGLRSEADPSVIVVAGLPVHHYAFEDAVAEV